MKKILTLIFSSMLVLSLMMALSSCKNPFKKEEEIPTPELDLDDAYDNLEDEVKITILATGFAVSNIPGMSDATIHLNRTTEEETKESAEEKAKRLEEEQRKISLYYGEGDLTAKRTIHSFIMDGDDLFNDDLIDALDSLPTYARSKHDLSDLEAKRINL